MSIKSVGFYWRFLIFSEKAEKESDKNKDTDSAESTEAPAETESADATEAPNA